MEIVNEPNKLLVNQGKEFHNNLTQKQLDDVKVSLHSTHNEGKSVVAERVIRTLKVKFYKEMAVNNSKSYLSYLNKLLNEHDNTYHRSIGEKTYSC